MTLLDILIIIVFIGSFSIIDKRIKAYRADDLCVGIILLVIVYVFLRFTGDLCM